MRFARLSSELEVRALRELLVASRDSVYGAALTQVIVCITHVRYRPALSLVEWFVMAFIALLLRYGSASLFIQRIDSGDRRAADALYALQWLAFGVTALIWVSALVILGDGTLDTLFFLKLTYVLIFLSYYLTVIGIDMRLYSAFVAFTLAALYGVLLACYGNFLNGVSATPFALALFGALLVMRSRVEQARLQTTIESQLALEQMLERARAQADHDGLTGALNRRRIQGDLKDLIALAKRQPMDVSIVMLDVDFFKSINDNYGHNGGDDVLKALVAMARRSLREIDRIGRWGGEEFLIVLPSTDLAGALVVAEKFRASFERHKFVSTEGREFYATLSLGVAQYKAETDPAHFVDRADRALYFAKETGRNKCVFHDETGYRTYSP